MEFDYLELKHATHHLYMKLLEPILKEYDLTRMEVGILLFLSNNPQVDTASQMVSIRRLTKSHVSGAVTHLAEMGYLERFYEGSNQKTVHLRLLPSAYPIINAGKACQQRFREFLMNNISDEEMEQLIQLLDKVMANTKTAFECLDREDASARNFAGK